MSTLNNSMKEIKSKHIQVSLHIADIYIDPVSCIDFVIITTDTYYRNVKMLQPITDKLLKALGSRIKVKLETNSDISLEFTKYDRFIPLYAY